MTTIAPETLEIDPQHLSVTAVHASGSRHNVHVVANSDLEVILAAGQDRPSHDRIPCNVEDTGLVVVSLGIDGNDQRRGALLTPPAEFFTEEALSQAIDTLTMARDATRRATPG